MTEERHEQDVPQLRGQQHGHLVDVRRVRGCAVSSYRRNVHHVAARQRALHMVRRHAWQFHGAGVEAAVRDLPGVEDFVSASEAARDAMTRFVEAFRVSHELVLSYEDTPRPHPEFMAPPASVVGWRSPSGLLLCLAHPHREATPVWNAPGGATCAVCSEGLAPETPPPLDTVCLCTHSYSSHNVNGLCIEFPGVLGCGCLGWSEVRT